MIGMSLRSGWTMGLSGLPRPVPPGIGERVVRPVVGHRRLTGEHLAHDVDVLAGAGQRLREGLAVPALDDLGPGDAEAEDEATAGQVVEGQRGHGHGGRGAGRQLAQGGAEADPRRCASPTRPSGVRASEP